MKLVSLAAAAILAVVVPATVSARPYVPHHTSAGTAHGHHLRHGHHGAAHRHGMGHHRTTKAERHHRRANTHHYGNPNARNPHQEGYQQQLGNTTNGPRY